MVDSSVLFVVRRALCLASCLCDVFVPPSVGVREKFNGPGDRSLTLNLPPCLRNLSLASGSLLILIFACFRKHSTGPFWFSH